VGRTAFYIYQAINAATFTAIAALAVSNFILPWRNNQPAIAPVETIVVAFLVAAIRTLIVDRIISKAQQIDDRAGDAMLADDVWGRRIRTFGILFILCAGAITSLVLLLILALGFFHGVPVHAETAFITLTVVGGTALIFERWRKKLGGGSL
jgi:hypothetical protein